MTKFNTHYNYDAKSPNGFEKKKGHSLTVKDMSYSIRELLNDFTSVPEITRAAQYDENPDIDYPNPNDVDLTDLLYNMETIKIKQQQLQTLINERKQKDAAKAVEPTE